MRGSLHVEKRGEDGVFSHAKGHVSNRYKDTRFVVLVFALVLVLALALARALLVIVLVLAFASCAFASRALHPVSCLSSLVSRRLSVISCLVSSLISCHLLSSLISCHLLSLVSRLSSLVACLLFVFVFVFAFVSVLLFVISFRSASRRSTSAGTRRLASCGRTISPPWTAWCSWWMRWTGSVSRRRRRSLT